MGSAPPAGRGFFPLDEELALLPGTLTPSLQEQLVRLGSWLPFAKAAALLTAFTRVSVTEATSRRQTERAGALYAAWQEGEVARLERELPPPPSGPPTQVISVDGVMVPLLHGEWAEVKNLVIGEVAEPLQVAGEEEVHSQALSYFSRLGEAETFARLSLVETQRRGTETSQRVAAVTDGAEWEQGFIDFHRPDAVRILDFPHAAQRLAPIGAAVFGEGTPEAGAWVGQQVRALKQEGATEVLAELRRLAAADPTREAWAEHLCYLEKRESQMEYPRYQAAGLPIGSGIVESGNKVVVEARLKGAGMHWERGHVNPMLALRNGVCNDRWEEAWRQIALGLREAEAERRVARQQRGRGRKRDCEEREAGVPLETAAAPGAVEEQEPGSRGAEAARAASEEAAGGQRPQREHPWRRYPISWAKYHSRDLAADARQ
jgi:hypothetical protein